jgi:hypothetical protein
MARRVAFGLTVTEAESVFFVRGILFQSFRSVGPGLIAKNDTSVVSTSLPTFLFEA